MLLVLTAPDIKLFYTETLDVEVDRQNYQKRTSEQKETRNILLTNKNKASLAYNKPIGLSAGFFVSLSEAPWLVSMATTLSIANPRKRLSGL